MLLVNKSLLVTIYRPSITMSDWNAGVIAEFRRNRGKVGGQFEGAPLLLINHTGARTGKSRTNPVMYFKDGHRYIVFASKGGADTNPDWYHNLKAHPDVKIEVGTETIEVRAEEIIGAERNQIYTRQASIVSVPTSIRSEEHTSELQSHSDLVCRLLLEKKKNKKKIK